MSRIFVLSDIHGHYDIFIKMLQKIDFKEKDTLYILGDCNDRGPDSLSIYHYILSHDNIHLIKGNHELMMRDSFIEGNNVESSTFRLWVQNGGRKTIDDYHAYLKKKHIPESIYRNVRYFFWQNFINYINSCPSYIEVECNGKNFVLIHAGINPEKGLYEQTEEECAWMREYFYMSPGLEGKTIIFGHTPTMFINNDHSCDPWFDPIFEDKIGIDGGLATFNEEKQLNCLCLNTMENFVVKAKEVEENL